MNAIVTVLADQARKEAAEADRKIVAGDLLGPLHGVPFTIKENIDFAGTATTWGVKALANAVAPLDAPVVERMRAAGAVRVAMVAEPPGAPTDPAIAKAVRDAGVGLRFAGYAVDEVVPPRLEEAVSTWARFILADFLSEREQLLPIMGKDSAFFFETAASAFPALDSAGISRRAVAMRRRRSDSRCRAKH